MRQGGGPGPRSQRQERNTGEDRWLVSPPPPACSHRRLCCRASSPAPPLLAHHFLLGFCGRRPSAPWFLYVSFIASSIWFLHGQCLGSCLCWFLLLFPLSAPLWLTRCILSPSLEREDVPPRSGHVAHTHTQIHTFQGKLASPSTPLTQLVNQ